jgi:N-methylhydantoinase A
LHAVELARSLRIPTIIMPTAPGALSAVGVLVADVVKDQSRTVMFGYNATSLKKLPHVFREMERDAAAVLRREGFSATKQRHERALAMRYRGQSFELLITRTEGNVAAAFHRAHRERYGYSQEHGEIEIVSARLRSIGLVERLSMKKIRVKKGVAKPHSTTKAHAIYKRDALDGGLKLRTPCIVTEYSATTLIPADATAHVDQFGNILIQL